MKKESRFYKKGIKILLAIGLLGTMIVPTNAMANEYVTPGDAKKTNSESVDVEIHFNEYDDSGSTKELQVIKKNVKVGSTFKEAGIQFPTTTYKDLTLQGWVDNYWGANGRIVDENTVFDGTQTYFALYPDFDKVVMRVYFQYPDINNDIKGITVPKVSETFILEHGTTLQDLADQLANYHPEDMSKEAKFSGWVMETTDMDQKIVSAESVNVQAEFENKTVLLTKYFYYNTKGQFEFSKKASFISKNASKEQIVKEIPFPESFKGLRQSGWEKIEDFVTIEEYGELQVFPKYENCLVRFAIGDMFREENQNTRSVWIEYDYSKAEAYYPIVAEKGEIVKVPEMKGYDNIVWLDPKPEGDNLVIKGHTDFHGYIDKGDTPVVNPDDGNHNETEVPNVKPDDGDNNNGNKNETEVPDVTLPEESINDAVNEVKDAAKGDKVTVDMKGNVTLPVEVLESAKGKDVEVVFNMGAYSWSINGLDITADTLKAINLEVKLNANAISADIVKALAKGRPTMQLSLLHNGEFGFKAKLQFNIGAKHKGKYGNLYYYNEKGKLEFMNAGKIDEAGNVSLEFTHASDYVVVIDEKSMAEETKKTESPIKDTSSDTNGSVTAVMVLIALLGGAYCLHNKKAKVSLK